MRYFLKVIVFTIILSLGAGAPVTPASAQFFFFNKNPLIGKPAADFQLPMYSGETKSMSSLRDGKRAIIFFWATWCPHCRETLKKLNPQAQALEQKGIKVILVDIGESKEMVAAYVKKNDIKFDIFLDENTEVAEKYQIIGVPSLFIVNENGNVIDVVYGIDGDPEKLFTKK